MTPTVSPRFDPHGPHGERTPQRSGTGKRLVSLRVEKTYGRIARKLSLLVSSAEVGRLGEEPRDSRKTGIPAIHGGEDVL